MSTWGGVLKATFTRSPNADESGLMWLCGCAVFNLLSAWLDVVC